ncbi:MAG: T9SS type A sorting domain-containing protein [Edaphocola sp.]
MKVKNLLVSGIALTMALNVSYAGHNQTKRNGCWFLNKRFKMDAHVTLGVLTPVCLKRGGDCDYVTGICSTYGSCGATASSHAGWDGLYGSHHACGGYLAGLNSDLIADLAFEFPDPITEATTDEYGSESNFMNVDFIDNVVNITDIQFEMHSSDSLTSENTFTLTIWAPHDDEDKGIEDDEISDDEVIYSTKVSIINGNINIEGNLLNASYFTIESNNEGKNISYVGSNVSVVLPEEFADKVIAVTSGGDIKPKSEAQIASLNKKLELTDFSQSVQLHPNPATNSISVKGNWNSELPIEYGVYDVTGKAIISKKSTVVNQDETIELNISNLTPGNYYFMIKSGDNRAVKSFVKQ